jgi:hypothetical protein
MGAQSGHTIDDFLGMANHRALFAITAVKGTEGELRSVTCVDSNVYEPWLHGANRATERFETWAQNGRKTPPI